MTLTLLAAKVDSAWTSKSLLSGYLPVAKHPGGGEPTNVYEIIKDPNLLSFLRAAGTTSLEECQTLLRKHAEKNGVG